MCCRACGRLMSALRPSGLIFRWCGLLCGRCTSSSLCGFVCCGEHALNCAVVLWLAVCGVVWWVLARCLDRCPCGGWAAFDRSAFWGGAQLRAARATQLCVPVVYFVIVWLPLLDMCRGRSCVELCAATRGVLCLGAVMLRGWWSAVALFRDSRRLWHGHAWGWIDHSVFSRASGVCELCGRRRRG